LMLPHDLAPGESVSIDLPAVWPVQAGNEVVVEAGGLFSMLGAPNYVWGPNDRVDVRIKPAETSHVALGPAEPGVKIR